MSNIPYIVANNKKFIKSVYMLFMFYLKIELKENSYSPDREIRRNITAEIKKRNLIDILNFSVMSAYDSIYEITISDSNNQTWLFEIHYSNLKKIELVEVQKKLTNLFISNTIKESSLFIITDKQITKKIDLKNYELSKEEIDMLCLEHDVIISNHDIKNMVFKNPEMLDFVWDYYEQ